MSEQALTLPAIIPAGPPNSVKTHVRDKKTGKRLQIGKKLKAALDLMVWQGKRWNEAARAVDFEGSSMRKALERPHVQAYLRAQKQVFRASVSCRNISVLEEIRDSGENQMARLGAVKLLEQIDEQAQATASAGKSAGVTIQILQVMPGSVTDHHRPIDGKASVINAPMPEETGEQGE